MKIRECTNVELQFQPCFAATDCGAPPLVQNPLVVQSKALCINNVSFTLAGLWYTYYLSCSNAEMISFGSYRNTSLANYCMPSGRWKYNNFSGLKCGLAPTSKCFLVVSLLT